MNTFLFLASIYIFTFFVGRILERARVPWIFAALLLGVIIATVPQLASGTSDTELFAFLGELGMFFLLFLVGFEVDIKSMRKRGSFIVRSSFIIIPLEALFGTLLIHYVFGYAWIVSVLVALSFATVGEAILVPILDEFKIINTPLGQSLIGIGTLDDIIEILTLIFVGVFVGTQVDGTLWGTLWGLVGLFGLLAALLIIKEERERFKFKNIETIFLLLIGIFFLFVGVGSYAGSAPLGALLAGVGLRLFLPEKRLGAIESEVKTMTYGLFAPLFFVWVGAELDIKYLLTAPLLIFLVVLVANGAKILGSYISARHELGVKGSILLGIGLSARFSTGLIVIKFLFDNGVIQSELFSVIVASSIIFTFIVPVLFSQLVTRWGFANTQEATAQ